ncbi:LYR motif-containing protein 4 [Prunus yedoensis var. nudiflora]|uniref:LYR motif-containing protein 4 n=1 Tax=Prunus yedoensis var. nudiflora TaxID=2094558 RepID=A0A314ZBD0_PRUYE|nr:LYR motif-containing protein 4 [Prunus yedoensis var. nudiflora]
MSIAAGAPSRAEVLTLFRSFLRVARKFTDYNIREWQGSVRGRQSAGCCLLSLRSKAQERHGGSKVNQALELVRLQVRGLFTYVNARFQGTL